MSDQNLADLQTSGIDGETHRRFAAYFPPITVASLLPQADAVSWRAFHEPCHGGSIP